MFENLPQEQKNVNAETLYHITLVGHFIHRVVKALLDRADAHDRSKLESPEVEIFAKHHHLLSDTTFGTKGYEDVRALTKEALDHHYAVNRHHPQHFKGGVADMNLIDLIEMFCDWKAATRKHKDGNLLRSIAYNANHFNLDPQIVSIFENTADLFDD